MGTVEFSVTSTLCNFFDKGNRVGTLTHTGIFLSRFWRHGGASVSQVVGK